MKISATLIVSNTVKNTVQKQYLTVPYIYFSLFPFPGVTYGFWNSWINFAVHSFTDKKRQGNKQCH